MGRGREKIIKVGGNSSHELCVSIKLMGDDGENWVTTGRQKYCADIRLECTEDKSNKLVQNATRL